MNLIIQHDLMDCGAACLAMVASGFGYKRPLAFFRNITKTTKDGTSIYGIVEGAEKIGLNAEALYGTPDELIGDIQKQTVKLPCIAHIETLEGDTHFIVLKKIREGIITVWDPGKGKIQVSLDEFLRFWSGNIISFEITDQFERTRSHQRSLLHYRTLLKGQYRQLAVIILLSVVVSAIGIMGAFVFQLIIDHTSVIAAEADIDGHTHTHEHEHDIEFVSDNEGLEKLISSIQETFEHITIQGLSIIFMSIIGLYLLAGLIHYIRGKLIIGISRKIDLNLTLSYFNHILKLPVYTVSSRRTGDYLSRFSDAASIRNAVSSAALTLIIDSMMAAGCGIILFLQSPQLFLISAAILAAYAIIVILYRPGITGANRRFMENNASVQSYLKESIDGIESVKASNAEEEFMGNMSSRFNRFLKAAVRLATIKVSQEALITVVESVGIAVILWSGFSFLLSGTLSLGTLMTFYVLLGYFISPVKNLISLQPTIHSAEVAAERLSEVINLPEEEYDAGSSELPEVHTWAMDHVSFRYGSNELTLDDITLKIRKGEKVAVVGESGCGKTTLAKLMMRFYSPEKGRVTINGEDIGQYNLSVVRNQIAYVSQDPVLFAGTVEDNLRIGNPDVSTEDIREACRIAQIDRMIDKLPKGLQTQIKENGSNLSGGQRQRLSIARALLKKPQLLILDEATSNLDTITESGIKDMVFSISRDMTCIIIAHRLSTIKNCDRIVVMQEGRVIESGTHEELLEINGKYAEMIMD